MIDALHKAASVLNRGGVIIYPTEGLFGLSCRIDNKEAVLRILQIKKRSSQKGLIVIADSIERAMTLVDASDIHPDVKKSLSELWPGHNTIILPRKEGVLDILSGQFNTLAVRVTAFKPLSSLVSLIDCPIVSTSANISGEEAVMSYDKLQELFSHEVDYIAPLECGGSLVSSTIIDGLSGRILRQGKH